MDSNSEDIDEEQPQQDQAELIKDLIDRIADLENKLKYYQTDTEGSIKEKEDKLKPIDIKDIERPDKYDNQPTKFNMWYDKFKDLLMSRNENWGKLLDVLETRGRATIKDQKDLMNDLVEEKYKSIKEQSNIYAQHLKSYLRTYTDGELHARVIQTSYDDIMELMREVIHRVRNRNPSRLIDLKAKALTPEG